MQNKNEILFFPEEVKDIKPLKNNEQIYLSKKLDTVDFQARKRAALIENNSNKNHLAHGYVEKVYPNDMLEYKKAEVRNSTFRRLSRGNGIEANLDLHNYTVSQAREQVYQFVEECIDHDIRVAIIVHGKGNHTTDLDKKAIIKSYTNKWLRDLESVIAFHSAQRRHGGLGAVYVLFKKNKKAHIAT